MPPSRLLSLRLRQSLLCHAQPRADIEIIVAGSLPEQEWPTDIPEKRLGQIAQHVPE